MPSDRTDLPEDWVDQVSRAYAAFQVDPLDHADEFGLFGRVGEAIDVDFLREKAKRQFRDALGRWREMRGSMPNKGRSRANRPQLGEGVAQLRRQPNVEGIAVKGYKVGPEMERPRIRDSEVAMRRQRPIRHLRGKEAARALAEAGVPRGVVDYYAENGVTVTRDGVNFTWVPTAAEKELLKLEYRAKQNIQKLEERLQQYEKMPDSPERSTKILQVRDGIKGFQRALDDTLHMKNTSRGSDASAEDLATADKALGVLERASDRLPTWRRTDGNGRRRPLMTLLSEEMMVYDDSHGETFPGSYFMVMRRSYDEAYLTRGQRTNWIMDWDADSYAEYTVLHELGHNLDEPTRRSPHSARNPANDDVWNAAKDLGHSRYGGQFSSEGFAEAAGDLLSRGFSARTSSLLYAAWFGFFEEARGNAPNPPPAIMRAVEKYTALAKSNPAAAKRALMDLEQEVMRWAKQKQQEMAR